jgi:hypothetical protein
MDDAMKFFNKYKEFREEFKAVFFHDGGKDKLKAGW